MVGRDAIIQISYFGVGRGSTLRGAGTEPLARFQHDIRQIASRSTASVTAAARFPTSVAVLRWRCAS